MRDTLLAVDGWQQYYKSTRAGGRAVRVVSASTQCSGEEMLMQSLKQDPIYLPDVENNPQPGPYKDLIQRMQDSGGEYWQIWHLFAFRPETTTYLARFTQGVMREPAPISSGLRELIAAYTSKLNECEFCMKSHAAVSSELLGDDLVGSVLRDFETSPLEEGEKALLRFVGRALKELPAVTPAVMDQ